MARIKLGGSSSGNWIKWNETDAGTVLEGTWLGARDGKFGPIGELETENGKVAFPIPIALGRLLEEAKVGAVLDIQYEGMAKNDRTDRTYHAFSVFMDVADPAPPATDTDVPF